MSALYLAPCRDGYKLEYNSTYIEYNSSVQFMINDFLYGWLPDVQSNDIIIVGTGPHWLKPARPGANLSRWEDNLAFGEQWVDRTIREIVAGLLKRFARAERIIWRIPDVSHFHSSDTLLNAMNWGWVSGRKQYNRPACVPWEPARGNTPNLIRLYKSITKHTRGTRIELFDVLAMGAPRYDAHPGFHNMSYANKTVYDCLHWCLPGVPDAWNEVLIAHLCGTTKSKREITGNTGDKTMSEWFGRLPIDNRVVLVTALYDIGREHYDGRSMEQYLQWFTKTLQVSTPMVVFVGSSALADHVHKHRHGKLTYLVIRALEDVYYSNLTSWVASVQQVGT